MHRCPNRACPSRGLETLINWVGIADIEGVGEQTIRLLWERGLVRSLPDLYRLTKEQLLELDGFAEISATAARRRRSRRSKQVPFSRVLLGLNIPKVGWVLAQNLARQFGNVDRLRGGIAGGGRGDGGVRPRPRGDRRRVVRGRRRTARSSRSSGSSGSASRWARRTGRPKGRSRADVRHHGHAREVLTRRGDGRARGASARR